MGSAQICFTQVMGDPIIHHWAKYDLSHCLCNGHISSHGLCRYVPLNDGKSQSSHAFLRRPLHHYVFIVDETEGKDFVLISAKGFL